MAFDARQSLARQAHPDYDAAIKAGADLPAKPHVREHLRESEVGAELLYFLATHPAEADRIDRLTPRKAVAELGKLEARHEAGTLFEAATDDEPPAEETPSVKPARVPVSKAPAPMARVTGGTTAGVKNPDNMTQAEYNAWRDSTATRRR